MAAITFKNFENPRTQFQESGARLFTDLALDLKENTANGDIKVATDERAIVNSIYNILTTRPGQNLLFPEFGINLAGSLFEQISQFNGRLIGEEIVRRIEQFEPRVSVLNANVNVNIDRQEYKVTLVIYIPSLNTQISLDPVFTQDGAIYLGTNPYE